MERSVQLFASFDLKNESIPLLLYVWLILGLLTLSIFKSRQYITCAPRGIEFHKSAVARTDLEEVITVAEETQSLLQSTQSSLNLANVESHSLSQSPQSSVRHDVEVCSLVGQAAPSTPVTSQEEVTKKSAVHEQSATLTGVGQEASLIADANGKVRKFKGILKKYDDMTALSGTTTSASSPQSVDCSSGRGYWSEDSSSDSAGTPDLSFSVTSSPSSFSDAFCTIEAESPPPSPVPVKRTVRFNEKPSVHMIFPCQPDAMIRLIRTRPPLRSAPPSSSRSPQLQKSVRPATPFPIAVPYERSRRAMVESLRACGSQLSGRRE
ncbi:hypothetical protein P389DRAFT_97957 [Cystobasidium minutum MCA 4210]|uniref:uncharacterized protein n=1 Tax=Cystobasidium minutum MCA 4210 TaxID=1397322 RepID=UPI0034CD4ABD|eukprot:jgi/Rhomi1/97957/CE97956_579